MQTLLKENNKKLQIEKTFVDGGEDPVYAMQAGFRVMLKPGRPAGAIVHMGVSLDFFYDDGTAVDNHDHIGHLTERMRIGNRIINPREMAKKQVDAILAARAAGEKPPAVKTTVRGKGGVKVTKAAEPRNIAIRGSEILRQNRPDRLSDRDRPADRSPDEAPRRAED